MLLGLKFKLEEIGLKYDLISLKRVDVPFSDYTAVIIISNDMVYKVFIIDKTGELMDMEICDSSRAVIEYIQWYDCQLIWG